MDSFIKVFLSHLVKTVVRSIVDDKQDIECEMQSSLLSDLLRNMDVDESVKTNIAR